MLLSKAVDNKFANILITSTAFKQIHEKMGSSSTKEATEEAKANRSLNLSCKLTPKQYVKAGYFTILIF